MNQLITIEVNINEDVLARVLAKAFALSAASDAGRTPATGDSGVVLEDQDLDGAPEENESEEQINDTLASARQILAATNTSDSAITAAVAQAASSGWTHESAVKWATKLYATRNGRALWEVTVADKNGYAPAEVVRVATGRKPGNWALAGLNGGITKTFNTWKAQDSSRAELELPMTTGYLDNTSGRQRAQGFQLDHDLVPLFRIALAQTLA